MGLNGVSVEMLWGVGAVLVLWWSIAWVRRMRDERERRNARSLARGGREEIDYAELEEAERDIREAPADGIGRPFDGFTGDDWGPGAGRTPLG